MNNAGICESYCSVVLTLAKKEPRAPTEGLEVTGSGGWVRMTPNLVNGEPGSCPEVSSYPGLSLFTGRWESERSPARKLPARRSYPTSLVLSLPHFPDHFHSSTPHSSVLSTRTWLPAPMSPQPASATHTPAFSPFP